MMRVKAEKSRALLLWILGLYALLIVVAFAIHKAGARLNLTESLPMGLYWTIDKPAEKGDLVLFSPPATAPFIDAMERRYIHRNLFGKRPGILLKEIAAVAGDKITIAATGITVNGEVLKNSVPLRQDTWGRDLPICFLNGYVLAPDEVFLFSGHNPDSFDGRYFGVQKRNGIKNVVRPVLIYVPFE